MRGVLPTFTETRLAHRLATEAAERAGLVTGRKLRYEAFDSSCGQIKGCVRALARAGSVTGSRNPLDRRPSAKSGQILHELAHSW